MHEKQTVEKCNGRLNRLMHILMTKHFGKVLKSINVPYVYA